MVDRLNVPERRLNFRELQEKWPHLADLELTEVSATRVALLLTPLDVDMTVMCSVLSKMERC